MIDVSSINTCSGTTFRGPEVKSVPVGQLRTSYAHLRPGKPPGVHDDLKDLPLRVVVAEDGGLEVVDGFKRLARWREIGATHMPVVIEHGGQSLENKRLLLQANAPRRTITPMDEALVVRSLVEEDKLTLKAIAKLLGRKVGWVSCRLALSKRLSASATEAVAKGALGVSLALAMTALSTEEQDRLLESIVTHGLRSREAILLVHTYRIASPSERKHLLKDPVSSVRPKPTEIVSPRAADIESRLEIIGKTIHELRSFSLPADLAPAEERRLSAIYRSVCQELTRAVQVLGLENTKEESHENEQYLTEEDSKRSSGLERREGMAIPETSLRTSPSQPEAHRTDHRAQATAEALPVGIAEGVSRSHYPTVDSDRQRSMLSRSHAVPGIGAG